MAQQTAEKFLELLEAKPNLRVHQQLADAQTVTSLTRFAAGKGFIFSEKDLHAALEAHRQKAKH